jgi:hypothetical protein
MSKLRGGKSKEGGVDTLVPVQRMPVTTAAASASRRDRWRSVVCEGRGGADEGQRVAEEAAAPPIQLLLAEKSGDS